MEKPIHALVIGIVGPCAAGKSTLVKNLAPYPLDVHHIAQEHSYVADMWLRITKPERLIFLDVSYPITIARQRLDWTLDDYLEQHRRLRHARQHADLYLDTDLLSPQQVAEHVLHFLGIETGD
jgi:cytidylate kinase